LAKPVIDLLIARLDALKGNAMLPFFGQSRRFVSTCRQKLPRVRRLWLEPLESRRLLATFTVDTLVDESDGNFSAGDFSLREAIGRANLDATVDRIDFEAGLTGTIVLGGSELSITQGLVINGPGADKIALSGNNLSRIFSIQVFDKSIAVNISGMTISRGNVPQSAGGGIVAFADPSNPISLSLNRVRIVNNTAGSGGGIFAAWTALTVLNSAISGNVADFDGGGICTGGASTFLLINSTVSRNRANTTGGGVHLESPAEFRNSTITGNRADADGNNEGFAGGVDYADARSSLTLKNTIVAGNYVGTGTFANDLHGQNVESGSANNLIGDADSAGGLTNGNNGNIVGNPSTGTGTININTVLDTALLDNGGPTPTHSLVAGSPALDRGNNALALNQNGVALVGDQRGAGFARIVDGPDANTTATVDIGAYEAQGRTLVVDSLADENDGDFRAGDFSLREAIARANTNPAADVINFESGLTGTIVLGEAGTLLIRDALALNGLGGNVITVSGNNAVNVLSISGGLTATISSLNITAGLAEAGGAGISIGPSAKVTLNRMLISSNHAPVNGGGIFNLGFLTLLNSTVSGNTAGGLGGGILHSGPGPHNPLTPTLRVLNSTISGNQAAGDGGGVHVFGNAAQFRSTTITGNRADSDGTGGSGGGIFTQGNASTSTTLFNTIVAGNLRGAGAGAPDDISGKNVRFVVSSNNLIGDAGTAGNLTDGDNGNIVGNGGTGTIDIDTVIDTLRRFNGGPTPTHALKIGSLAIDRGNNALATDFAGATLTGDQRAEARIRDGLGNGVMNVDIGAFEVDLPVIASFDDAVTYTENNDVPISSTVTITDLDSPNFALGRLTVRITASGRPEDRLTIRTSGAISTDSNNKVLFAGQIMGTFSGGIGTTPLVIAFNDQATPSRVQLLLRNVVYSNVSDDPFTNDRTVLGQVTDGDGGFSEPATKTISVVRTNDAPMLGGIGGSVDYTQNSLPAIQLAAAATVDDPDSTNFAGGLLLVRIISGGDDSNRLLVGGPFTLLGGEIQLNGETIGTRNAGGGVGTTRLEITLNANATRQVAAQLVQAIRFRTFNGTSTDQRVIEFSLTDGDGGGANNKVNKMVNVT